VIDVCSFPATFVCCELRDMNVIEKLSNTIVCVNVDNGGLSTT